MKAPLRIFQQLNEYETDQYFLQNFHCTTSLIHAFCKICEHEIVLQEGKSKQKQFHIHVHKSYKKCKSTLLCIGNFKENIDLSHIHLAVLRS